MKKKGVLRLTFVFIFLFFSALMSLWSAEKEVVQKEIQAYRANESIKVDGMLSETVWQNLGYDDFTQRDPLDGSAPTEKTVVWAAYDGEALYIAARLFDSQPDKIIGLLGRRDDLLDSDWFMFAVDPYLDRRTGYQFGVNPAGSIVDMTLYNDENEDYTWDGLWDCAAKINDKGWTVEMRIPFSQLRFKKEKEFTWGINFRRVIKRKNETNVYAWTPKEMSGYVSRFAKLKGMKNIKSGYRIELLPFTSGKAEFSPAQEENPFKTGEKFIANAGIDLKVGLKSNLILDMSFNPDFGQVEVDPAVINLSASEVYYGERRPFFIEGSSIFNFGSGGVPSYNNFGWMNPRFFYSRRIGRPPQGGVNTSGYVDYPSWTTILATVKLTGKIGKGWNVGFINALTEREYAEVDVGGERENVEVEPSSYYGVLRIQKEFNEGKQGLGFIATSVVRGLRTDSLKDILGRNAFTLGVDGWFSLNKKRSWVATGWLGATTVTGSTTAISNRQRSYLHYYQRPDADYLDFDPNATSLNGWSGRLYLTKMGGNFIFNAAFGVVSPGFDSTDIGFQYQRETVNAHIMTGYASLHPGKTFRNWRVVAATGRNYDFGGNKTDDVLFLKASAQLLNYLEGQLAVTHIFDCVSNTATRGGPLMSAPAYTVTTLDFSSDNRKSLVLYVGGFHTSGKYGNKELGGYGGLLWKPGNNFSLSFSPEYSFNRSVAQWVRNVDDPLMLQTYGTRHIFSTIDQKTLSFTLRFAWIFSPKLSLQAYIQPFIAVGKYEGFKELARPGSFDFNTFGEGNSTITYNDGSYEIDPDGIGPTSAFSFSNPDFNYKSLRGTVVLRWEYRPGSTLYAVWTQNRADYANPGHFRFGRDFGDLLRAKGDNIFMIKFTYHFGF